MFLSHSKRSGFTLIELLVVIAIIGTLASTVLVSVQDARRASWDARVRSDVKTIQTALELYRNANGQYPVHDTTPILTVSALVQSYNDIRPYISSIPVSPDPKFGGLPYGYWRGTTDSYLLWVKFSRHPTGTAVNGTNYCYIKKGTHTYVYEGGTYLVPPCPEIPSSP